MPSIWIPFKLRQILRPGIAIRLKFAAYLLRYLLKGRILHLTNHFFASPTIWLRHQSFDVSFDDESWSRTPLRRNLIVLYLFSLRLKHIQIKRGILKRGRTSETRTKPDTSTLSRIKAWSQILEEKQIYFIT